MGSKEKFVSYSRSKIFFIIFLDAGYVINDVFYFVLDRGMGIFFASILILFSREKEFFSLYKTQEFLS
nr:hypothetical protein [Leptospira mayottensis]